MLKKPIKMIIMLHQKSVAASHFFSWPLAFFDTSYWTWAKNVTFEDNHPILYVAKKGHFALLVVSANIYHIYIPIQKIVCQLSYLFSKRYLNLKSYISVIRGDIT